MRKREQVKVLIITGAGLNCEKETAAAFASCGATAEQVHLNDLLAGKRTLGEFHILALIGGFSFGDKRSLNLLGPEARVCHFSEGLGWG